jgi:outer membrane protein OmpA-like peptidoglycan-associated protein
MCMKKSFAAFALMLAAASGVQAQDYNNDAHLGLKAGVNFANLRLTDQVPTGASSGWLTRPVGGFFGNIPLAKRWSLQLEGLYSLMGSTYEPGGSLASSKIRTEYISLPLLFKFHATPKLKVLAGGQWDIMLRAKSENDQTGVETDVKDLLAGDDFGLTGGLEFWPAFNWVIQARYIYGLADVAYKFPPTTRNQAIQLTLGYRFGKKPVPVAPPPPPPPPVVDTDNDGVLDPNDKCPTVPGLAKYDGCPIPDTDKDGVNDEQDKCPTVAGLAKYQGCPIPDTDKDGINDEEDKCPTVAGLAKYQGCPIPDTDGDGINDEEDRCPDVAGVPEMKGCPAIDFQASDVTFQSGKAILTTAGKKELDVEADFLNKNSGVKVSIEGHTDNTGTDKINQPLSEKRAEAVKTYLASKGVAADRMTTSGFGSSQPIADNKTAAGKQKNRRVEIKVQ